MQNRSARVQPSLPALSPALQTLLACVRDDPPALIESRLSALGPDASELLLRARYHRLTSILCLCLQRKGLHGLLPAEHWERLVRAHLTLAARQTRMVAAALEIIQALAAASIRCLPLKGLALVAAAWPQYMPRDMWDLDLLIPPEDWPQALTLFERMGFAARLRGCQHCPWIPHPAVMTNGVICFEPHTAPWGRMPMEPLQPRLEELWARTRPGALLDQPVAVPSPEDRVFILLAGLARDRFDTTLRSWADLRWLLTTPGWAADPQRLWEQAAALRAERLLSTGLRFAGEVFGGDVGLAACSSEHNSAYERARPILWRRLLSETGVDRVPRAALRVLAGGAGTGEEVAAAGRAWGREHPGLLSRTGRLGTALALAGGALAYGARLLTSARLRRELREECLLLQAVRAR